MVWDAKSLSDDKQWTIQLTDQEINEVSTAVRTSLTSNKPIAQLNRADFPFNTLGERLLSIKSELLVGRGFTLIRGLPADSWSDEALIRAYWGIGQWIGDPVSQNAQAHLLGHVVDQRSTGSENTRIYQTNQAQPFHSDSCDIVGLLCLRTAKNGGASSVASSAAIHNQLLNTNPALLDILYREFQCDRYGEIPEGKLPHYPVRVFNEIDDQLVCCGMDPDIRSAQRLTHVDRLSVEQVCALDAFQQTASELSVNMSLQRGDVQLANNLTVVHAREAFTDHSALNQRRYLIRLWLSSAQGRTLPAFLSERWGNIDVGSIRGGIKVPGAVPVVILNPSK